ncbi:hypothetical protein APHAL10511_001413 [Amanita phalloides]|nr:hypothetical protein APHAL10511_001413 [Amanita phalloides]
MTGHRDDIVIAVLGSTGTGKSSFIRLLTGDTSVNVGNGLESETSHIQVVPFRDPESSRKVIIVDTPGFDDSREGVTDTDVLKRIAEFLLEEYDKGRKLNGLIYLNRISDPKFGGQSRRNLTMFRNLCGTEAYENVVVLTTFWDKVSGAEGEEREEELRTKFFKHLAEGGARFMRHIRTLESARQVLRHISTLVPTHVQIQEEIRLQGKALEDTAAGSVRREEVDRIIAKHNEEMTELKGELEAMRRGNTALRQELEEERTRMEQELARWKAESEELKKGLDEAQKAQEGLKADAVKERENHKKWRQDQQREWNSRFDEQKQEHGEAMKRQREEYERRQREAAAKEEENRRGYEEGMRRQRDEYERRQQEAAVKEETRRQEYEEKMRREFERQRQEAVTREEARRQTYEDAMKKQREEYERQQRQVAAKEEARQREHEEGMRRQREEYERQRREEARRRVHEEEMRQERQRQGKNTGVAPAAAQRPQPPIMQQAFEFANGIPGLRRFAPLFGFAGMAADVAKTASSDSTAKSPS